MEGYINSVSFEACLAHIFSFLDLKNRYNCESVCTYWRNVSLKYWCNIKHVTIVANFSTGAAKPEDYFINYFKRNTFNLKSIDLSQFALNMDDNCLRLISNNCKNLQRLVLTGYKRIFSIDSMKYFAENCSQLKSLFVSNINDDSIREIFYHCHFLEKFEIINNQKFEGSAFTMLPVTLTHLNFDTCSMLTVSAFASINRCANLKSIRIKNCGKVSTEVFEYIGKCTTLQDLHYTAFFITLLAKDFEHLCNLTNLRKLTLECLRLMDDFSVIFSHCPIEIFEIPISPTILANVKMENMKCATHLKEFYTSTVGIDPLTDDQLKLISCWSNLRVLYIRDPGRITDDGVLDLIEKCKYLTVVNLNKNYCLTNAISLKLIEIALDNPNQEYKWIINGSCMEPLKEITLPKNLYLEVKTLSVDNIERRLRREDFYSKYDPISDDDSDNSDQMYIEDIIFY